MKAATWDDKSVVLDILCNSFHDNISVNSLLPQNRKDFRIRALMSYAFDQCFQFGSIILSDDNNGCALILDSTRVKFSFTGLISDLKFVINGLNIGGLFRALDRQKRIKSHYPVSSYIYLWFIGVRPESQGKYAGTELLAYVMNMARERQLPVLLETSRDKNIPWYSKNGFNLYQTINIPHNLYFFIKR